MEMAIPTISELFRARVWNSELGWRDRSAEETYWMLTRVETLQAQLLLLEDYWKN